MSTNAHTLSLLGDALEQVLVNPAATEAWHRLCDSYTQCADEPARSAIRSQLVRSVPDQGIAGFFRATFLADVTDDPAHIAVAAELVQQIQPIDVDRLMAFALYEWGRAIAKDGGGGAFLARLRHAQIPEIMALASAELRRRAQGVLAPRPIETLRKIALVVPFLGLQTHTPTLLAFQHASILQQMGLEVRVFSTQEFRLRAMPAYLGNMGTVLTPVATGDVLTAMTPPHVTFALADERFSLMRRWHDLLRTIAEFDPDLVLFVGLNAPIIAPLFDARPVLGLSVHAVPPMAPVDLWLTADSALADRPSAAWAPAIPPAVGFYHPYRINLPPITRLITRADLRVTEADLLLVTVGSRLGGEIGGDWAARMVAVLARNPRLVWILIGGAGVLPPALVAVDPAQIRLVSHQADLRSLVRCCDIYVNPQRVGGGFSVAEAMADGLPVLAFADSDGGSKLGDFAVETMAAYFDRLDALIDRPDLRAETGAAMRALFAATLDLARSGPSLRAACAATLERFRQRQAAANPAPPAI